MTTTHWTDNAAAPAFTTRIRGGNIYAVVGEATAMLRQLDIPTDRIEKLKADIKSATSYDEALAFVKRWFPVDR